MKYIINVHNTDIDKKRKVEKDFILFLLNKNILKILLKNNNDILKIFINKLFILNSFLFIFLYIYF
jgi:hypothetical protein